MDNSEKYVKKETGVGYDDRDSYLIFLSHFELVEIIIRII